MTIPERIKRIEDECACFRYGSKGPINCYRLTDLGKKALEATK